MQVIIAVTIGNILEWYDIYLIVYLAPVLSKVFFNFKLDFNNLLSAFLVFGTGFIARPFGSIIYGRIGDLIGRKNAFISSIVWITLPTLFIGCLPTYSQIGIYAPILLFLLRFFQSIPAAGEVPGCFCFLYEYASSSNKRFMGSWGGYGNQIGAILAVLEIFIMDQFASQEFLNSWGWRISFWIGALIGLSGVYLRRTLTETPMFIELKKHHNLDRETIRKVIFHNKKKIMLGVGFGAINAATFYLIATYIPTYFSKALGLNFYQNTLVSVSILMLTTVPLPLFGILGDKINNKLIFIICTIFIILLLFPLYYFINSNIFSGIIIIGFLSIIPITCITALIPYLLANQFSTSMRFLGVGLTFNIADGIIGGFTPAISLFLINFMHNQAAFIWYILICSLISLFSYFTIKD